MRLMRASCVSSRTRLICICICCRVVLWRCACAALWLIYSAAPRSIYSTPHPSIDRKVALVCFLSPTPPNNHLSTGPRPYNRVHGDCFIRWGIASYSYGNTQVLIYCGKYLMQSIMIIDSATLGPTWLPLLHYYTALHASYIIPPLLHAITQIPS